MTDPAMIAAFDQLVAFAADEGRRVAAFHQALRDGGVPAALAARLTTAWQEKVLWPNWQPGEPDDE